MNQTEQVTVADGKYTVVIGADGSLSALRHGEPWRDLTGDKLVYCLAAELIEARKALETASVAQPSAEPFNLHDVVPPSAHDWLAERDGYARIDLPEGWTAGWDACRNRTRTLVIGLDAATRQGLAVLAPAGAGEQPSEVLTVGMLPAEYVESLKTLSVGKDDFNEQYMQKFPERRIGEDDRRKVFYVNSDFVRRAGCINKGRRKTDVTDYTTLPKINEFKT